MVKMSLENDVGFSSVTQSHAAYKRKHVAKWITFLPGWSDAVSRKEFVWADGSMGRGNYGERYGKWI